MNRHNLYNSTNQIPSPPAGLDAKEIFINSAYLETYKRAKAVTYHRVLMTPGLVAELPGLSLEPRVILYRCEQVAEKATTNESILDSPQEVIPSQNNCPQVGYLGGIGFGAK